MLEWIAGACVLLAVIIALRYLLKGKISLRLQYGLWALALLRLLVPVSLGSSGLSVMNAVPEDIPERILSVGIPRDAYTLPQGATPGGIAPAAPGQPADGGPGSDAAFSGGVSHETGRVVNWGGVAKAVWLSGAAAVGFLLLLSNLRLASRLKRSRRALEGEKGPLPVYLTDAVETPCLFGLFRPAIYVTAEAARSETKLRHVIAHETTHRRQGDHIWCVLRGLCLALHWYNPLVWWAAVLSRRDAELACDEATIGRIGEGERAEYGRTLIGMTCQKRGALLTAATTMTGGESGIRERIRLIARKPRMATRTLVAVVLIAAVAVGCTFTGAKDQNGSADADVVLYESGGYTAAIPKEYADQLIVHTGEELSGGALISVYEKASAEAAAADGYADSGLGWLFSLVRYDRTQYERYLCEDGSGRSFFAKDDDWYYGYFTATDMRYYHGSGLDQWETLNSQVGPAVRDDFITRNKLAAYSDDEARKAYTYGGEHRFLNYYPYYSVNGSKDEVFVLVLSQPVRQGEGGIWCVERMLDGYSNVYLWFPDSGMPAADYYAGLQAGCDAGQRPELLEARGAAMDFLNESGYFGSAVVDGSLKELSGDGAPYGAADIESVIIDCLNLDGAYAEAAQESLIACLMKFPAQTLEALGAREEGIRNWLCWHVAASLKGRGSAVPAVDGLGENGEYARALIMEYLSQEKSAPKSWRQVYLDFWNETLSAQASDGEIVGIGLMDFNFDGVPELITWQSAASASEFAVLYYTDGLQTYHNLGSGYTAVLWDRRLPEGEPPPTFWLVKSRETGAYCWCVHSQNGQDGSIWGGYQLLYAEDRQLVGSYETQEGAREAWEIFDARYEIVDLDYSAFVLSALAADSLDAAGVNAFLNAWRPLGGY